MTSIGSSPRVSQSRSAGAAGAQMMATVATSAKPKKPLIRVSSPSTVYLSWPQTVLLRPAPYGSLTTVRKGSLQKSADKNGTG